MLLPFQKFVCVRNGDCWNVKYGRWVAFGRIMFILSFMKVCHVIEKVLFGFGEMRTQEQGHVVWKSDVIWSMYLPQVVWRIVLSVFCYPNFHGACVEVVPGFGAVSHKSLFCTMTAPISVDI